VSARGTIFGGSSDAYDRFMGRYSTPLAVQFADFAGVAAPQRTVDVGAGTGALTDELVRRLDENSVAAAEPSTDYAATLAEPVPRARRAPRLRQRSCPGRTGDSTPRSRSSSSFSSTTPRVRCASWRG
jgi:hypothetical protein